MVRIGKSKCTHDDVDQVLLGLWLARENIATPSFRGRRAQEGRQAGCAPRAGLTAESEKTLSFKTVRKRP